MAQFYAVIHPEKCFAKPVSKLSTETNFTLVLVLALVSNDSTTEVVLEGFKDQHRASLAWMSF